MFEELGLNPWLSIWVRPRATIRRIVERAPRKCLPCLYWVYGFPTVLGMEQNMALGESMPLGVLILLAALLAVPIGWLFISIGSALLTWTGNWIGGKGHFFEVRASMAWSNVPLIGVIGCWIALVLLFGQDAFSSRLLQARMLQGAGHATLVGLFIVQLFFSIWSFILLLKSLGEVQGFSAWKALLNVCIPIILIFAVIWVLVFVGGMLSMLMQ